MSRRLVLCVALAAAVCGGVARAQTLPAQKRTWFENFNYLLAIDGVASPQARVFSTNGRPAVLVMAPEFKQPLVIDVTGREVKTVNPAMIEKGPIPEQVLLPDTEIVGPPSPYTMDGDAVVFFLDGRKVRLGPKPPLLGPATSEELIAQLPAYRKGMQEYAPAESDTVYLKGYKLPVRVEVFFGSWCPHCREAVPRFLKSMSVASNDNIKVSFVGVPPPPFGDYPPAKEKNIKGVPTFIVYAGDKEIGRVSAVPGDSSVEHELVKILFQYEQGKG
ncbi:MAG TPA: thioredoxin family protein [Patescibacteria group bacterium]|jgi:thiol-disulfide isomerase/thioredoxin|nr:thioredoxin family protein [Patescibacteria group bacterium]